MRKKMMTMIQKMNFNIINYLVAKCCAILSYKCLNIVTIKIKLQ